MNLQKRRLQGDLREPEYFNLLPATYNTYIYWCTPEQLGYMNIYYQFCSVLHWLQERVLISSIQNLSFKNCCKQRAIVLEESQNILEFISNLFQANSDALCKYF